MKINITQDDDIIFWHNHVNLINDLKTLKLNSKPLNWRCLILIISIYYFKDILYCNFKSEVIEYGISVIIFMK